MKLSVLVIMALLQALNANINATQLVCMEFVYILMYVFLSANILFLLLE